MKVCQRPFHILDLVDSPENSINGPIIEPFIIRVHPQIVNKQAKKPKRAKLVGREGHCDRHTLMHILDPLGSGLFFLGRDFISTSPLVDMLQTYIVYETSINVVCADLLEFQLENARI